MRSGRQPDNRVKSRIGTRGPWDEVEADERYGRIRRLLTEGHSDLAIAREIGCNERTVLRYRKKHGIPNIYKRSSI